MLTKYEFLKILRKKSTLIVMAVSLLLTGFLFGLPILQFQTYSQDGVIKGGAGIAYEKKQYQELSVPLTEEYVEKILREYQQLFENPDNVGYDGNEKFIIGGAYWNDVAPRENLLSLIASVYDPPGESSGLNNLPELDLTGGARFYQSAAAKTEALLNMPSRALSAERKDYWRSKSSRVEKPLQYGYHKGWETTLGSYELLMFALLAVCIAIAPVFAGEYQSGTDAVILSGKYGKTRLATAKITASVLFGLLAFTLHVLVALGLTLAAYGIEGWNLPLQLTGAAIPYPLTFLQAAFISLGVVYLVLLAMIALTLLLSARMKSPYLVLTVLLPVLFLPLFLSPNGTGGAYNLILFLLPYRAVMPEFDKYISYQAGGLVLDALTMRAILYTVLTAVLLPLARRGFRKHQAV